jgi:acetoin:2,6-dichlorophenolindophenol oxidoreductase subunit alpha
MTIGREKLLWMYRTMVRQREFEDRVAKGFAEGKIPGFVHLSQGQEATAAGPMAALRGDDYITSFHRGHGHLIAKGGDPKLMMAELHGKATGMMKGKGGSMHLTDPEVGDLGADGLLATQVLTATGAALSAKYRGTDQVAVCFIGDGCINTGSFHEGINMAAAWKLPLVCLCENNVYAETTSIYDSTNLTRLTNRALGYGVPGVEVDGTDPVAVYEVVAEAVARARRGDGPTFIEAKTCRWRGHFEGDSQTYRTKEELEDCRRRDPVLRFQRRLIEIGIISEIEAAQIRQEAAAEMDNAEKFAEESPFPEPKELLTDVYA